MTPGIFSSFVRDNSSQFISLFMRHQQFAFHLLQFLSELGSTAPILFGATQGTVKLPVSDL